MRKLQLCQIPKQFEPLKKFRFEQEARLQGYQVIAGVDEAGRGPIAGPVVVAACILPEDFSLLDINDSKKLATLKRESLYQEIISYPGLIYSIVVVEKDIIDEINILQATLKGMRDAVEQLTVRPDYVLVDGNQSPNLSITHQMVIQGDSLSYSIGAASILAKVKRDEIMCQYHEKWPEYGFATHKGYPTEKHLGALMRLGPCPIHRESYAPVQRALQLYLVFAFLLHQAAWTYLLK